MRLTRSAVLLFLLWAWFWPASGTPQSETLGALQKQKASLESTLQRLRGRYSDLHPEVKRAQAALDSVNKQIGEERQRLSGPPPPAGVFYVAPDGSDTRGNGSAERPWATLSFACRMIPDNGSTVLVRDGVYNGRVRLHRRFTQPTVFRAEHPYRARLQADTETVVTVYDAANLELAGFEIMRPSPAAQGILLVQVARLETAPRDIILRNNILHDSYNNDLLKINNGLTRILIEGNVFYNQQGKDEHIDVNGATEVTIRDNIFFNDFAGSGRENRNDTGGMVVIKNSGNIAENGRHIVQRNVFMNWEGYYGANFILIGEDGKPFHEAVGVMIENNLMIGNSPNRMRAALGVKGAKNIIFRNNTVAGDLPSMAYAARLNLEGKNPVNDQILFFNNIWSDPTGSMGEFSHGRPDESKNVSLDNNLYWNAGQPIQVSASVLNYTSDKRAMLGDPKLAPQAGAVLPRWTGQAFLSGSQSIRQEFERLVWLYGTPGPGSAVIGRSDPARTPADDILGRKRKPAPDLGAFETGVDVR